MTETTSIREIPALTCGCGNPIIPGYYADPTVVQYEGSVFVYATIDPWGGDTLACWESTDFQHWTYRHLNWPTRAACSTPESGPAAVWAPSVVRARDGRFYMYVSVGSEVWCGVADHPLGPWHGLLDHAPLIPRNYFPGYHMIDAEAFLDDDGTAWLYWGSGLEWVNGRCWAVRLTDDMAHFDGEPVDVTPGNYFEAPFMLKRDDRYYLMYSSGRTDQDSYQVHYAVGESPTGPFAEAENSPILVTDAARDILSPGHHTVFEHGGEHYIMYHRHSVPFVPGFVGRQLCVDKLVFAPDGTIETVVPTHEGPGLVRRARKRSAARPIATASSRHSETYAAERVLDDNHASRWTAAENDAAPWIALDLGHVRGPHTQRLRFEYAWMPYHFIVETSLDGHTWSTVADHRTDAVTGSPIEIAVSRPARFVRLRFAEPVPGREPVSLIAWECA
jgi:beta-xylosidase